MNKSDLERITKGMAQGSGEFTVTDSDDAERAYNLVGAVNALTSILDEMEKYNLSTADLTDEQQEELDLAQQALQYYEGELGALLGSFTGNDGGVTLGDGTTVDLPNAASSAASNVDIPDGGAP